MKYYSEITQHVYDTIKELREAETAKQERDAKLQAEKEAKSAERKRRAQEVHDAEDAVDKAMKAYRDAAKHRDELLRAFLKDYGSYHYTITTNSGNEAINKQLEQADTLNKLFNDLFRHF